MRRTPEDAAATRAALLEAALFVFAEQGVESATLAEVAGRAGPDLPAVAGSPGAAGATLALRRRGAPTPANRVTP